MSDQQPLFVYTRLDSKLRERLDAALKSISALSKEDVLRCDSGYLTEIVREFAVSPPILRSDSIVADERILESVDMTFERKTGHTNHSFFIPIERDVEWLEEVDGQRTVIDSYPLAFLDKKHARISIRLMLSLEDEEGALKRKLNYRISLVEQYTDSVASKIIEFNKDLAEKVTAELNKRKSAILKAEKELENTELPRVDNPEHEERAIQNEHLLRSLGTYMTSASSKHLRPNVAWGGDDATVPPPMSRPRPEPLGRNKVFISYSHRDKFWLERLQVHLKPLERLGAVERWDDTLIIPGSNWREEIKAAIAAAKVAILIVSADFLASDFIVNDELPPLLAAAEQEGAVILPVIVNHCRFQQTESLARFQAVNCPSDPLIKMRNHRREEVLVRVTEAVEMALCSGRSPT